MHGCFRGYCDYRGLNHSNILGLGFLYTYGTGYLNLNIPHNQTAASGPLRGFRVKGLGKPRRSQCSSSARSAAVSRAECGTIVLLVHRREWGSNTGAISGYLLGFFRDCCRDSMCSR